MVRRAHCDVEVKVLDHVPWPMTKEMLVDVLGQRVSTFSDTVIASLWGGVGTVSRIFIELKNEKDESNRRGERRGVRDSITKKEACQTLIVKHVDAHFGSDKKSRTKVQSYRVEGTFYRDFAQQLNARHIRVPEPFLVADDVLGNEFFFILEDLLVSYPVQKEDLTFLEAQAVVRWMAKFHAFFWESAQSSPSTALGKVGSYWELEKRQPEYRDLEYEYLQVYKRMRRRYGSSFAEEKGMEQLGKRLKAIAKPVDAILRGHTTKNSEDGGTSPPDSVRYMTVVHGDVKGANILLRRTEQGAGEKSSSSNQWEAALYDFQWCGRGYGVVDFAYFMCSSVKSPAACEQELLTLYYDELVEGLGEDRVPSLEVMTRLYEIALIDFVRFLVSWGMWGDEKWILRRTNAIMSVLDGGRLLTAEEYAEALHAYLDSVGFTTFR